MSFNRRRPDSPLEVLRAELAKLDLGGLARGRRPGAAQGRGGGMPARPDPPDPVPNPGAVAPVNQGGSALLPKLIVVTVLSIIMSTVSQLQAYAGWFFVVAFVIVVVIESVRVIPQQQAWVVERLGKFHGVLEPGLRIIVPFVDRIQYRHSLKEVPLDVPEQVCITRDNTQLSVDGIIYYQVTDPRLASYGSSDYITAITQLAQTTLRSEIGKMELDRTFESRDEINRQIVAVLDEAGRTWGVKVLRYEIKNLTPPDTILRAMQAQITAEREKRALIAKSEGQKQEEINLAEGAKQSAILRSEGERAAAINNAQGDAQAIIAVADATAQATRAVAEAIGAPNGLNAANLKVAELYVNAFGNLAKAGNTLIVPANMADMASLVGSAMTVLDGVKAAQSAKSGPNA
jgi:regulator of protease activity HflC (stomatin/prohibitin superfamily)